MARVGEDDIPLVDCVSVGVKAVEMIVDLNKKLGMPFISRTGFCGLPRRKDSSRVRGIFGLRSFGE